MRYFDVCIIGGGASGLVAASCAKGKVAVIEKEDRVGKKILLTGNGRCNLSNVDLDKKYYSDPDFYNSISINHQEELNNFFDNLGLFTRVDGAGRVYPYSNHASGVLDSLRYKAERNAELFTGLEVRKIVKREGKYEIITNNESFLAKSVIYACGGGAISPIKDLGLNITPFCPMLCPIATETDRIKGLDGVRVNASVRLVSGGRKVYSESGEILFRTYGVSGVAIFNCSAHIARAKIKGKSEKYDIVIDFLDTLDEKAVQAELANRITVGTKGDRLFTGLLHRKVGERLLKNIGLNPESTIRADDIDAIMRELKSFSLKVKDLRGEGAQVTSGGVKTDELDIYMESKKHKNLFIIGEGVDMDGLCGGYNLHWAFLSAVGASKKA